MDPIKKVITDHKFMILEGGQATELERLGCDLKNHLWSARILLDDPDKLKEVYSAYLKAGADCITTATYQATFPGLSRIGLSDAEIESIFSLSVKIACESRDEFWSKIENSGVIRPKPLIAASIGPYGAYLADGSEYKGKYVVSEEELYDFHKRRIKTLMDTSKENNNIDLLAFETIPDFIEAKILAEILKEYPEMYAWLSFSTRDENYISEGYPLKDAVRYFESNEQIAAIGVNCTKPQYIQHIIETIRDVSQKPVIVYPNSGESYDAVDKVWGGETEKKQSYYEPAKLWYSKGAGVIGGCCRTTPEDIGEISRFRTDLQGR